MPRLTMIDSPCRRVSAICWRSRSKNTSALPYEWDLFWGKPLMELFGKAAEAERARPTVAQQHNDFSPHAHAEIGKPVLKECRLMSLMPGFVA